MRDNVKTLFYRPGEWNAWVSRGEKDGELFQCTKSTRNRIIALTYRSGIVTHLVHDMNGGCIAIEKRGDNQNNCTNNNSCTGNDGGQACAKFFVKKIKKTKPTILLQFGPGGKAAPGPIPTKKV